jgi:hypothetical protein
MDNMKKTYYKLKTENIAKMRKFYFKIKDESEKNNQSSVPLLKK